MQSDPMSSTPPLVKPPPDTASDQGAAPGRRTRSRHALECAVQLTMADGSTRQAITQDISRAGLSLITDRPIAPGKRCILTLQLPHAAPGAPDQPDMPTPPALALAAKTVYSSYVAPRQFRIGLVFTQPDPALDTLLAPLG